VKSGGIFSGLFGFGSSPTVSRPGNGQLENIAKLEGDDDNITAVVMGAAEADGVDVWVLSTSGLAVWRVSDNMAQSSSNSALSGSERLVCKVDALSGVQEKLLELYGLADDGRETAGDMYAEGPEVGLSMAGGLPMQMERRERRILALGAELLDVTLVKTKIRSVDPREPSTETDVEMETVDGVEELMPVILVGYSVPTGYQADSGGISWQSSGASHKKGSKRQERAYATIACRFVGADQLAGSQSNPIQSIGPSLRFEAPSLLPYSDLVNPRTSGAAAVSPGVSIGFGVSKSPGSKEGWFAPRLASFQATVARASSSGEDDSDDEPETPKQAPTRSITLLAATFEGGMVFSTNGTWLMCIMSYL